MMYILQIDMLLGIINQMVNNFLYNSFLYNFVYKIPYNNFYIMEKIDIAIVHIQFILKMKILLIFDLYILASRKNILRTFHQGRNQQLQLL